MTDPQDRSPAAGEVPAADPENPQPGTTGSERPLGAGGTGPGPVPAEGDAAPDPAPASPPSGPVAPSATAEPAEPAVPVVPAEPAVPVLAPPTEVERAPAAEVEPAPAADVEPAPAADVEPAPAAEVELAPAAEVVPTSPAAEAAATPPVAESPPKRAPVEYEEAPEPEVDDDLEPIPRWVSMVNTLGVGLVAVVAAWVVAAIVQGFSYPANEGQGVRNDLLHRLGTAFVPTHWVLAMVVLILAVVLVSLPVLFEEDVTYGQERAASVTLTLVVALAVIVCLGAVLAVRSSLHAVTASGQAVPSFYRIDRTAFLLAVLGTGILAAYGALVARGLRYGRD